MRGYLKVTLLFLPLLYVCESKKSNKEVYTDFPESIDFTFTYSTCKGKRYVSKYILDRYITCMYVDESRNVIFATDINNDQPIITYQLPSF